jgi:hypothetical protein
MFKGMNIVRLAMITGCLLLFVGCKSPPPTQSAVDPNIATVSTAGLRLGMTPAAVLDLSTRQLYVEDERNERRLSEVKENEPATIRLNQIRSRATHERTAFFSNAVTLRLEFARNRLIQLEERHTGLGQEDLRAEMKALSSRFNFVTNRMDTGSSARWAYQGRNRDAYVRLDFRFVPSIRGQTAPMSSYTIVVSDPAWALNR